MNPINRFTILVWSAQMLRSMLLEKTVKYVLGLFVCGWFLIYKIKKPHSFRRFSCGWFSLILQVFLQCNLMLTKEILFCKEIESMPLWRGHWFTNFKMKSMKNKVYSIWGICWWVECVPCFWRRCKFCCHSAVCQNEVLPK